MSTLWPNPRPVTVEILDEGFYWDRNAQRAKRIAPGTQVVVCPLCPWVVSFALARDDLARDARETHTKIVHGKELAEGRITLHMPADGTARDFPSDPVHIG